MRALIVDDEALAREAMRQLLLAHEDVQVVGEAAGVDSALRLLKSRCPDLLFLDVQLRGETGFDLIAHAPLPLPRIIFVTAHDRYAAEAFRAEATDYLLKPVDPAHLAHALRRVAGPPIPTLPRVSALQTLGLTAREAEVLYWIAHGKSNPEIAHILRNAPGTVKKQVQSLLGRLGVESRVSAALIAVEVLDLHRP